MARIIELVGSVRPDYVKLAPIVRALRAHGLSLEPRIVHAARSYDAPVSAELLEGLAVPRADVYLEVPPGRAGESIPGILAAYERHLRSRGERPWGLVVVGDADASMACALAAVKQGVAVAHVEAGLRTFDRTMPEETHRVVTDAVASLCLVGEPMGESNLSREGVSARNIRLVGNATVDSLQYHLLAARALDMPGRLGLGDPYGYVTVHRSTNIDDPVRLAELVGLLESLCEKTPLVFPVHPRTRSRLTQFGLIARLEAKPGVCVQSPLTYAENLGLLASATVVITDSSGIQDEASALNVPCLTLLGNTERSAATELGTSTLVGGSLERVPPLVDEALAGRAPQGRSIPLWDGRAADRIVYELVRAWGGSLPPSGAAGRPVR